MIVKTMKKIGKEIKKNICEQMEKMNGIVIEQIEYQKRVKGTKIDKRRRKKEQYGRMDKRERRDWRS